MLIITAVLTKITIWITLKVNPDGLNATYE
jgi:hypothetical protein